MLTIKFHRLLVDAVVGALQKITEQGAYSDRVVESLLKQNPRWGSRDRKFVASSIYEIVRNQRLIAECCKTIPLPAEANPYLFYFAVWQIIKGHELPGWIDFQIIDRNNIINHYEQLLKIRKYRESVPDWLDELAATELGEEKWETELHALNQEAPVVLRVNTAKTTLTALQEQLQLLGIESSTLKENLFYSTIHKHTLILHKRQNFENLLPYKQGLFEVQDASSQMVAHFLDLKPGMSVVDACAGAGGKTLHMAALMQNKGSITAMDVEPQKLNILNKRALRAGASIITTQIANPTNINHLKESADRLLLDAPCSGLGVIKRNIDTKWKLTPEFIEQIKLTQQKIIMEYPSMLKKGGKMVYATCSILPSENQQQVQHFLKARKGEFELIRELTIWPSQGFDGFYMASILRH